MGSQPTDEGVFRCPVCTGKPSSCTNPLPSVGPRLTHAGTPVPGATSPAPGCLFDAQPQPAPTVLPGGLEPKSCCTGQPSFCREREQARCGEPPLFRGRLAGRAPLCRRAASRIRANLPVHPADGDRPRTAGHAMLQAKGQVCTHPCSCGTLASSPGAGCELQLLCHPRQPFQCAGDIHLPFPKKRQKPPRVSLAHSSL